MAHRGVSLELEIIKAATGHCTRCFHELLWVYIDKRYAVIARKRY